MSTIKIYSTLYSGQTALITFNPQSGGTINLGSQVIPYEYTNDYYWGSYVLNFTGSNNTCVLNVAEPTAQIDLEIIVTPGSINLDFNLYISRVLGETISLPVQVSFGLVTGGTVSAETTVSIISGQTSGTTSLVIDGYNYGDLDFNYDVSVGQVTPPIVDYVVFVNVIFESPFPENDLTYLLIPNNDLSYLILPNNDLTFEVIPTQDTNYLIIPSNDTSYRIIPNDDLSYLLIPTNDFTVEILLCTGATYTLVTLPYEPPSSGNTIFPGFSLGLLSGTTNPNNFDVDGIYWNLIDNQGIDTSSYFSGLTNPFIITFSQNGDSAIYSGISGSIDFIVAPFPPFEGVFYHDLISSPSMQPLTLIQPSLNDFVEGQDVCISFENLPFVPSPSPTPTETPTPTPTPTPTETETPTPTPTETVTPTITPTPTLTPNCLRQIVVPTLWDGNTSINTNLLQLTETSETLQIQVGDTITDLNLNTSIVGLVSSDGTYTYVGTGPGGSIAFNCQFPLTFSGPC